MPSLAEAFSPLPSPAVPGAVAVVLIVSGCIYYLLVHRWTKQRRWVEMTEWADANRFKLHAEEHAVRPEVLRVLGEPPPRVLLSLNDPDTALVQIETKELPPSPLPATAATGTTAPRWNLLIRRLESPWPTTGLRPVSHVHSFLDHLALSEFPTMLTGARFIAYGHESKAARALAKSHVQALLPQDIGLLLSGHNLLLDFSTRPFDPIELQRLDNLAEQLVLHLPSVGAE